MSKKSAVKAVAVKLPVLTPEQIVRLKAAVVRSEKRAAYNKIRNAREDVREARKAYNSKRWEAEREAKTLLATLTPEQRKKLLA
jgi:hypothetical protein